MVSEVKRAADLHNVPSAVRPCPKPGKRAKTGRRKQKTNRQKLVAELSEVCKQLTYWRDGLQCVVRNRDGATCGGGMTWSHVIAQGQSAYLRHNLSNAFVECRDHNGYHNRAPSLYHAWYVATFGQLAFDRLEAERAAHVRGHRFTIPDLREMLAERRRLYEDRFAHGTDTLEELVSAGYYGDTIRQVWTEEGRI